MNVDLILGWLTVIGVGRIMAKLFANAAANTHELAQKMAAGLNLHGKRLDSKKLDCVEEILQGLKLSGVYEAIDVLKYLEENRPVKAATSKRQAANKPATDTLAGESVARLAQLPIFGESRVFIVTSAQNNTKVNPVFSQLLNLAAEIGAEMAVLPVFYNKNAFSAAVECEKEYFSEQVRPYMVLEDSWLYDAFSVRLAAQAAILPTVAYPFNKAEKLNSGELVTIVGSPKQQHKMMPTLPNEPSRCVWSTGCVTDYNYIRSSMGAEAETYHIFGALLVAIDDRGVTVTNIRQGDNGSLSVVLDDWNTYTTETQSNQPDVVLGDLHCEMFDEIVWADTLALLDAIQPRRIAVHDILHFSSRSHHNRHSGKHLYCVQGQTVHNELEQVIGQLNELADKCSEMVYVVESNHNSALDIWLDDRTYSAKADPINAKLYHLLNWAICDSLDEGVTDENALQIALQMEKQLSGLTPLSPKVVFGRGNVSERWHGVEVSQHGHKGQNGSFGSPMLFAKWGDDLMTGHTHSSCLVNNVMTVGVTASKNQGYNRLGASSWSHAHGVIHSNGVKQLVMLESFAQ